MSQNSDQSQRTRNRKGLESSPETKNEFQVGLKSLSDTQKEILFMYLKGMVITQIARTRDCTENVVYKRLAEACQRFGFKKQSGSYYNESRRKLVELFVKYAPEHVDHAAFGYASPFRSLPKNGKGEIYVSRPMLENQCYQAITEPGGLCRIRGPKHTGKTTLHDYVLRQVPSKNYDIVTLSFTMADRTVFDQLESFLKWLCAVVSQQLALSNRVNELWDDYLACNFNITHYFESHLLKGREKSLVLVLDDTDRVFGHQAIAIDFCQLLRGWHDQARRSTRMSGLWKQLRLLIVHSTEIYGTLDINASPLANVGKVVSLTEFDATQIEELAQQNQIHWNAEQTGRLIQLIGGHPALAQKTFDQLSQGQSFGKILQEAHTEVSIYTSYLREHLETLRKTPDLVNAFKQVVESKTPIQMETNATFQLQSMGLVTLEGDLSKPRNELYRKYFHSRL
ncbi:MAG: hypothetical protein F6K19_27185 [Cyanothece sp. SIO1E1]|nr:hypothetical protein [Cyanothece sp. SIO1E1]